MMVDTWLIDGRTRVALLLAGLLGALGLGLTAPEASLARSHGKHGHHGHHSKHKAGGSKKPTDGDADNSGGPSDGDGNV